MGKHFFNKPFDLLLKPLLVLTCMISIGTHISKAQFTPGQLPVNLKIFQAASVNENQVKVCWTTLYEKDNAIFNIESSADGINFSVVAKVTGVNINGNLTDYIFFDNKPLPGLSFYRLKQIDLDSSFNYSPVVRVKTSGFETKAFIFPNPATGGTFTIDLLKYTTMATMVHIYDIDGRIKFQERLGQGQIYHIQHHLPAGTYTVKINGKEINENKKLIIQ